MEARPDAAQRQVVVSRQVQRLSDSARPGRGAPTAPVENVVTPPPPGQPDPARPGGLPEGGGR